MNIPTDAEFSPWIRPGWHVSICRDCQPSGVMPFQDRQARDECADEHRKATGHEVICRSGAEVGDE